MSELLPIEVIESYTLEDTAWDKGYPDNYDCRMRRDLEEWSFIASQREKLHLHKVWKMLTNITSQRLALIGWGQYGWKDPHIIFARALLDNYRAFSEAIK